MKVGDIYKTNEWGDIEVVEYINSKNVTVRFVSTGNIKKCLKDNIEKGLVADSEARKKHFQQIRDEERADRHRKLEEENAARFLARDAERREVEKRKVSRKLWFAIVREVRSHFDNEGKLMYSTVHTDRTGFKYQVVRKTRFDSSSWVINYLESKNTYIVAESAIKDGCVLDKLNESALTAERFRVKTEAAAYYEANRDKVISMALSYQKNNVERTRVRNRNRRARRAGADGIHTLDEVMVMLERQNNRCACCQIKLTEDTRELDHIMPLILGGSNYIENLQWLCQFCNGSKNATHPDEWAIYSASEEFKRRRLERLSSAAAS